MQVTDPSSPAGPVAGGDHSVSERSAEEIWTAVVAVRADSIAACDCGAQTGTSTPLTYLQVDELSRQLAHRVRVALAACGAGHDTPVAQLLEHNHQLAVATIAGLKTGHPELTLDASAPLDRLQSIVSASGSRVILTCEALREVAQQLGADRVIVMDEPAPLATTTSEEWAPYRPGDVYGITYTSGSTGAPKGIGARFRSIAHEVDHRRHADWTRADDQVGLVMPVSFGAAKGELLSSLFLGAAVHFFDPRARGAGPMPAWLEQNRITVLSAPPSLLTAVIRTLDPGARLSSSLRMVRSSGEKVLCSEAVAIRNALPADCRLLNAFGSSEATMISAYEITETTPDIPKPVPAGWPIGDREVRFERADGTPAEPGETAELFVTSRYLPAGYWRDEVRTRQRYTELPDGRVSLATGDLGVELPDGSFRLAGRKDLGVKIRGNLVEPAEVEAALLTCPGIQEAVVVGRPTASGRERLVAYLVAGAHTGPIRTSELRRRLRDTLPSYMLPEAVVFLRELPRNERYKLDRAALPEPPERLAADAVAPRTPWEEQVAQLWAGVLQLETISIFDDFFDLGGDSLSAEELMARLLDQHAVTASSRILLDAPTLAEFAAAIKAPGATEPGDGRLVPIQRGGTRPPLFCVAGAGRLGMTYLSLARSLGPDQPVWALQAGGREQHKLPEWSVRQIARRNVAEIRTVHPDGPYLLAGHSFGAVVAFEMAQQLRDAGAEVALLACLDSFPPHPRAMPRIRRRSLPEWGRTVVRHLAMTKGEAAPGDEGTDIYMRQTHFVSMLYRGKPYAGRAVVIVAGDDPGKAGRSNGWADYLRGPWELVEIPGRHTTMLREPFVQGLAARLNEAVSAVVR